MNREEVAFRIPDSQTEGSMEFIDKPHITKTPGVCGGRACIAGHRIRVMDIVVWHEVRGMSAAKIVEEIFPSITQADVHAALAYYFDNVEDIQKDFQNDQEWARWAENNLPSLIPPELKEKLGG
jgi:uncharacterized protein (DUF433 family)